MEQLNCNHLFQGEHTIAKEIFEGVTYPFEVLPKISEFIVKLGQLHRQPVLQVLPLLMKRRRFAIVPLSVAMPSSGRMRLWEIPPS